MGWFARKENFLAHNGSWLASANSSGGITNRWSSTDSLVRQQAWATIDALLFTS